nr:unnamed protein product [Callosobruchus analis]
MKFENTKKKTSL